MSHSARIVKAGLLAGLLAAGGSSPAFATQSVLCEFSEDVAIQLLMSTLDVASIVRADITAAGRRWSTQDGPGLTKITVGQAFQTASELRVDFTDKDVNEIVARLRLFQASDDTSLAQAGTLKIENVGVWPVVCSDGG